MTPSRSRFCVSKWILVAGILIVYLKGMAILWHRILAASPSLNTFIDDGRPSCDSVLIHDAYTRDNPLHPRKCRLKNYRSEDLVQCLGNLATAAKAVNGREYFHIAFVGDSRLRQMYHSLSGMLPLYDANVTGHIHTREILLHQDAEVISNVLQLKVTFLWRPYLDELEEPVSNWNNAVLQEAPDVLIIGNLIWSMIENYHVKDYSAQLQVLSGLLKDLTTRTKVIWWDQDQLDELSYHLSEGTDGDVNNKRIHEFNKAARQTLANTGVVIWNSTHVLLGEYLRACAGFRVRQDPWRRWNCPDAIHSSFLYSQLYVQRLLNYLCNPFMGLNGDFCCHSNQETVFGAL